MPAQDRESKKNFIGVLSERGDEKRAADLLVKSDRHMKDYFFGLMAAVLNRRARRRALEAAD